MQTVRLSARNLLPLAREATALHQIVPHVGDALQPVCENAHALFQCDAAPVIAASNSTSLR